MLSIFTVNWQTGNGQTANDFSIGFNKRSPQIPYQKGEKKMDPKSVLKEKVVLIVDDEVDVTDSVEEILDMCLVRKANDYETARQLLMSYTFDIVILDIMGVNGFELLKNSVKHGFPTVMLTAYALTPEALEKSIKLGAVSFLPKEKMGDLDEFLADVVLKGGQPVWGKLFDRLGDFFNKRFGPDWKQQNQFFEEFEKSLEQMKE
jgi:CheY-like chemotaxis protein